MKKFLFLAGAALLPSAPVLAQDGDPIVVTASGVEQSADETGRAVTVIDRAEIERRQVTALADLLSTTPGVTVSRSGGIGTLTTLRIRGAEGEQTLVLIDGVRANDPSSPGAAFDFANLLTGGIERVEVLRGANSVVWGSQAIGGVVNIVTDSAAEGLNARAAAEYGYADTIKANAAVSGSSGGLSGALGAGYYETDGISAFARGAERDGYRQYRVNGRLRAELAQGFGLFGGGYYSDGRAELDGFPPPTYALADTADYSTSEELYLHAGGFATFGSFANRFTFSLSDINRDNYEPLFGTAPSFFGRGRSERFAWQGDFAPVEMVRIVAGVEHEDSNYQDGAEDEATGITSYYGQLIVKPVAALALTGGVRRDDHRRFGGHTTFGASAALKLESGTRLRASYAEGFKAPTLYQLYNGWFGNRNLEPETSTSYEVGISQSLLDGAVDLGATWFQRDTRNQITGDALTFVYSNIARTHATGLELEMTLRPVEALSFTANYSLIDTENRSAGFVGKRLARRPTDTVNVSVDYSFPFGLKLGSALQIVSDSFDNQANTVRLDGYTLVSVRAEMPVTEQIAVYGRVENAFDERYQTVANYGTIRRAAHVGARLRLK